MVQRMAERAMAHAHQKASHLFFFIGAHWMRSNAHDTLCILLSARDEVAHTK